MEDEPGITLAKAVKRVNEINPEFVLLTGDIVNRYDEEKHILSPGQLKKDFMLVQRILLDLEVPVFITGGNHDLAFEYMRKFYRLYIGRPVQGKHMDYSFSFGHYKFITFEAFCHYNCSDLAKINSSLTPEQMTWLQTELSSSQRFFITYYVLSL